MAIAPKLDLTTMNVKELTQLIEDAKAKRAEKTESARRSLVDEMTTKAAALGLSLEALIEKGAPPRTNVRKPRTDAGEKVAAKYRGPNGLTWSGRGRKPTWLSELEAQGHNKAEFAI